MPVISLTMKYVNSCDWSCEISGFPKLAVAQFKLMKPQMQLINECNYKTDSYCTVQWTEISTDSSTPPISNMNCVLQLIDDMNYELKTTFGTGHEFKCIYIVWHFQTRRAAVEPVKPKMVDKILSPSTSIDNS